MHKLLVLVLGCVVFIVSFLGGCGSARRTATKQIHTSSQQISSYDTTITQIVPLPSNFPLELDEEINLSELGVRIVRLSEKELVVTTPVRTETIKEVRTIAIPQKIKTVDKSKVRTKEVQKIKPDNSVKEVHKEQGFPWWLFILIAIVYLLFRFRKYFLWIP